MVRLSGFDSSSCQLSFNFKKSVISTSCMKNKTFHMVDVDVVKLLPKLIHGAKRAKKPHITQYQQFFLFFKFSMIIQAIRFVFCLNEKSVKRDIGKKVHLIT